MDKVKKIGIVAHSYEGGSLCFLTACREGALRMGAHMHPVILLSAVPMGWSIPGWESDRYDLVKPHLEEGIAQVARAGADFFICPDNTAHLLLEQMVDGMPIPGLHIAEVVCREIESNGWKKVGLLGTKWTMTGPVYENALKNRALEKMIPDVTTMERINRAIFEELCQGIFREGTVKIFLDAIDQLRQEGAECVILGCTEIPLIVTPQNASLPVLDSTRLLARYAVELAIMGTILPAQGWIRDTV